MVSVFRRRRREVDAAETRCRTTRRSRAGGHEPELARGAGPDGRTARGRRARTARGTPRSAPRRRGRHRPRRTAPARPRRAWSCGWRSTRPPATVNGVAVVLGGSAVLLHAYAAPRSEGIWAEIRAEIAGGRDPPGRHRDRRPTARSGTELLVRLPVRTPEGRTGHQVQRFAGVDGPRWFLRAVFQGPAAAGRGRRGGAGVRRARRDRRPGRARRWPRASCCRSGCPRPRPSPSPSRRAGRRWSRSSGDPRSPRSGDGDVPCETWARRSGRNGRAGAQALSRLVASQSEVHAEHEQELAVKAGGTPIATLPLRRPATVCGTLRSVTLRPRAGVPALEAELYDGTGSATSVWLAAVTSPASPPGPLRVEGSSAGTRARGPLQPPLRVVPAARLTTPRRGPPRAGCGARRPQAGDREEFSLQAARRAPGAC